MSNTEQELLNKIMITSFVVPSLLCIAIIGFLIIYQKNRIKNALKLKESEIREKNLIIQKQQALQNERNRIAAEMHDDLGGGLTSIRFLAHRILKKKPDVNPNQLVEKILNQSGELVDNMSEIIWAMNSGFDTLPNLIAYCRNYIKKQCQTYEWQYQENVINEIPSIEFSGQQRRNIFLVVKEALNNSAKYAEANHIIFNVNINNSILEIQLSDDGKGFETSSNEFGNGLNNMAKRISDINGQFQISQNNGTTIKISVPLNIN